MLRADEVDTRSSVGVSAAYDVHLVPHPRHSRKRSQRGPSQDDRDASPEALEEKFHSEDQLELTG